jgi:4-amino-4-deoxy-L-arabinose transferase-like glycosyltransferase
LTEPSVGRRAQIGLLAAAAVLLCVGLGRIDAWAPDEPRYLQVAEEMRALPDGAASAVVPHLNGRPYDQKPPLYFWLAALAGSPAGRMTEATARLPSAVAGVALVALTLALGTRLFGGRTGLLGAALLLTTFEFAHLARRIQLDVVLAFFETAALALFWRIDRGIGRRVPQAAALHLCLGLGVLTKGPVGFLVPVLAMAGYLAWEGRLRSLPRSLPLWALPLSLGPGLAWIAAAAAVSGGEFAASALGENLIGRFFAGTSHERPFYYYLYQLPVDFLPWTLLAPAIAIAARRRVFVPDAAPGSFASERRAAPGDAAAESAAVPEHGERRHQSVKRAWRFLLAIVGASFFFFSLSSGKRGLYLLPAFPAIAILTADALRRELAGRTTLPRALLAPLATGAALVLAAGLAAIVLGFVIAEPQQEALRAVDRRALGAFGCAAAAAVVGGVAAWIVLRRSGSGAVQRIGVAVAAAWTVELAIFHALYPALDGMRSPRSIATAATGATAAGAPIGLVSDRAMLGGLLFYGGRPVVPLKSPESIRAFLDDGGRTFVVKARKLERITAHTPVREVSRTRAGRRAVLVVVADDAVAGAVR